MFNNLIGNTENKETSIKNRGEIAAESIANVFSSEPCNFTVTVDYDLDSADEFVCYVLRIYW